MEINNLFYNMIKNPKILIVDDSATNNLLIQSILADQGYEAIIATNGKEALKYINEEKFDLILLDIMMPKMNGFEVLEKLKEDNEKRRIPVIVITAKVETKDVKKAIGLGAVDYIKKPIDIDEIISRANMALRLKHVSDESRDVKQINGFLINILIKNFLNDSVNSFKIDDDTSHIKYNTINDFLNKAVLFNNLFGQYDFEHTNINIITVIDRVLNVFESKVNENNILIEKNYSGDLISKTDSQYLSYLFLLLFNSLLNDSKSKIVISIYNSNNSNIIKIYDDYVNKNVKNRNQLIDNLTSLFKLININFSVLENSISGNEYEVLIPCSK